MNLPNKISVGRIIFVPITVFIYIFPYESYGIEPTIVDVFGWIQLPLKDVITLILFSLASFSDFVDGYIARKYNLVTSFGKFIDPIADKLLVNSMFIVFAIRGEVPVIPVLLMTWRDMLVDGIRMQASSKGKVIAAGFSGKLKTVLQMTAIIIILLHNFPFNLIDIPVATIMIWISAAASVYSGWVYFWNSRDILLESM